MGVKNDRVGSESTYDKMQRIASHTCAAVVRIVAQLLEVSGELVHANRCMEICVGVKNDRVGHERTYDKLQRIAPHTCAAVVRIVA